MAILLPLHSTVRRDFGAVRRNPNPVLRPKDRLATQLRVWGVLLTLCACGAGCALFNTGGWRSAGMNDDKEEKLLKPLESAAPNALRLEYQIIERPADDPLVGNLLWDELTEIGLFDHTIRRTLNNNGLRVGLASNPPPEALDKLRGNMPRIEDPSVPDNARRRSGQVILLPEGEHFEAQTGNVVAERTVTITAGEETESRNFQQARGVVVVTARSEQEGWATVEFLPEIRYGPQQTRPVPGDSSWEQYETGQSVHKLGKQRFQINLAAGECVVMSSLDGPQEDVGELFFRSEVDGVEVQRLLVVRLLKTGITPEENG